MLKFNIYITCISILKYNKKGKLTSIENNTHCWYETVFMPLCSSAGLTIWQKRHMPRAPRFWGPRASLFYFFPEFFVPCFSAGPKQCARAGPQRAQVPQKTRSLKKSTPNVFFLFPVLVFQRGAPKSPRSPENVIGPQNLKIEAQSAGPQTIFLFPVLARDPNSAGP